MKRVIIPIVVILLASAAWAVYGQLTSGTPVQALAVQRGLIRQYIDEQGITRLPKIHLITMPQAGRIEDIRLREGQQVEQEQVVARIVPADLQNALDEARAAVGRLEAAIAENDDVSVERLAQEQAKRFVESMQSTVAAAENRKRAGQERMDYAESSLARTRELFQQQARSQDELDRAELEYVEGQVNYQQDVLITESMKSILAATQLLPQMVADYIRRKTLTRTVLERQRAEAEARLRQAQLASERGIMTSPVSGVVLERAVDDEQYLSAGALLLKIGQLEQLEVETDVLSEDAVQIEPGDLVELYGGATGRPQGQGLRGSVQRVSPAAFTKISSLGVEQQRVRVIIDLSEEARDALLQHDLGVHYRVRARIYTAVDKQALVVPRSALFRGPDGNWQLLVIRGGRSRLVTVEVGLMNDLQAQILSGVNENELVVPAPESSLGDGSRVRVSEA